VGDYVANFGHLVHLCERTPLRLLKPLAAGGETFTLEDHRQGRRRDAELLGHEILHPLGLRIRALEAAALEPP
jgi:hypothetical protein